MHGEAELGQIPKPLGTWAKEGCLRYPEFLA